MNAETIKQEIRKLIEKYTEDSNEVTAEEKISKKRVDYGFRINGIPKFFLEAKSLKESVTVPSRPELSPDQIMV